MTDDVVDNTPKGLRLAHKQATAENRALKRELAMRKALGNAYDTGFGKLFDSAFGGDLVEAEIKQAWTIMQREALASAGVTVIETEGGGFIPATPDVTFSPEEMASTAERRALANGSYTDPTPDPHPVDVASRNADRDRDAGLREDDVIANYFGSLVQAAHAGDKRAMVQ